MATAPLSAVSATSAARASFVAGGELVPLERLLRWSHLPRHSAGSVDQVDRSVL